MSDEITNSDNKTKIKQDFSIKLFDRWSFEEVIVSDLGLRPYININPIYVPRTNGYFHNTPFYKTKMNIIERLIVRLQICGHKGKRHRISSGHNTGKSQKHINMIINVLEQLEAKTKENPIQVVVSAIERSAPREEVITIERAGARYPQAVDIGPQRRIDLVLRYMTQGAFQKAFKKNTSIVECLVKEILGAYNKDESSTALAKRREIEKMAAAAK